MPSETAACSRRNHDALTSFSSKLPHGANHALVDTLVSVYGPRGSPMVWASIVRNVLQPLNADLAVLCSANCSRSEYALLLSRAKFVWPRIEPAAGETWDTLLSQEPHGRESMRIAARQVDDKSATWGSTMSVEGKPRKGFGVAVLASKAQLLERLRVVDGAPTRFIYKKCIKSEN